MKQNQKHTNQNEPLPLIKKIIPAIMPFNFGQFETMAEQIHDMVAIAQIDVMDGRFVDSISWPYKKPQSMHAGQSNSSDFDLDGKFREMQAEVRGLPHWEELEYEADLMVADPTRAVEEWASIGLIRVILHARKGEKTNNLEIIKKAAILAHDRGLAVSIAILPKALDPELHDFIFNDAADGGVLNYISGIQCMGIDKVGHQHQAFDPYVFELLKTLKQEIKEKDLKLELTVDGGVSLDTAADLFEAGADRLVVGSGIFGSDSPRQELNHFADIAEE